MIKQTKMNCGFKFEDNVSKILGAQGTIASGIKLGDKGDLKFKLPGIGNIRAELKATSNDSFSVKYGHLCKVSQEIYADREVPAFIFGFVNQDGTHKKYGAWVALPIEIIQTMVNE